MTNRWALMAAIAVASGLVAGCGSQRTGTVGPLTPASPRPAASLFVTAMRPGQERDIPNPGTGDGDPRLTRALLTRFEESLQSPDLPGATVAMPITERGSLFIPLRQVSSPLDGAPECAKWTKGMFASVQHDFDTRGVQLAVTRLTNPHRQFGARSVGLAFSEAIITGPTRMLDSLGDPQVPATCTSLTGTRSGSGTIRPLAVPSIGARSWAYLLTGSGTIPIWQWVVVVQTRRYVMEVRIPNQEPAPRTAPAQLLPLIAEAAYAKAEAALR